VPGHRLDQTLVYGEEYAVAGVRMSLAEGAGLTVDVEPEALPFLFALGPDQTVREIAGAVELPPEQAVSTVRRLLEHGLLTAAGGLAGPH
jgi:hypothetical protein